jgi:hypothetical protein
MKMKWGNRCSTAAALIGLFFLSIPVRAQVYDSGMSNLLLPVVVNSPTYQSEIYLTTAQPVSVTATVQYLGGMDSATPGTTDCGTLTISSKAIVKKTVNDLCPTLNSGSNYGSLLINTTGDTGGTIPALRVYSRVQNSQGIGFSIEAYPVRSNGGRVIGIKHGTDANGITYQTNCFVGNLPGGSNTTQSVTIASRDNTGTYRGKTSVSVPPGSLVRVLDVFTTIGFSPTVYRDSYTLEFTDAYGAPPPMGTFGFCTVQNNNNFSADFRMPALSQPTYQFGSDLDGYDVIGLEQFTISTGQTARYIGYVDDAGAFKCFVSDPQLLVNVRGFESAIGTPSWVTPRLEFSQANRGSHYGDTHAYYGYLDIEISLSQGATGPISATLTCNASHAIYGLIRLY